GGGEGRDPGLDDAGAVEVVVLTADPAPGAARVPLGQPEHPAGPVEDEVVVAALRPLPGQPGVRLPGGVVVPGPDVGHAEERLDQRDEPGVARPPGELQPPG